MKSDPGKQELGTGGIRKEGKQLEGCILEPVSAVAARAQSFQDLARGYVVKAADLSVCEECLSASCFLHRSGLP